MSNYGRHLSFPFRVGPDGRAARVATFEEHLRDELVQLVLTNPGERAFQTEFGGGVRRLVFENNDPQGAGFTKAMLTQAINRWLGHRLELEELLVDIREETVEVEIRYRVAGGTQSRTLTFQTGGDAS